MTDKLATFLDEISMGSPAILQPLQRRVQEHGYRYVGYPSTTSEELPDRICGAEVVITNKCRLTKELLHSEQAKDLKLILLAATGYNNIDIKAARARNITVCNVSHYATCEVAHHALALTLALLHRLADNHQSCQNGQWARSEHFCLYNNTPRDLSESVVGIIGYGAIGQKFAEIVRNLGAKTLIAKRHKGGSQTDRVELDELLTRADVVSLHCPLNEQTYHLIGAPQLAKMPKHSILINTARGGLIDERALADSLAEGKISGAGLDVLETEPPVDSPLLDVHGSALILTPHIAWTPLSCRQRLVHGLCDNLANFVAKRPSNVLA